MRRAGVRTGNLGKPLTLREAVVLGATKGWTSKETAFETGWNIHSLQSYAQRMSISFAYGGRGDLPKYTIDINNPPDINKRLKYHGKKLTIEDAKKAIQREREVYARSRARDDGQDPRSKEG